MVAAQGVRPVASSGTPAFTPMGVAAAAAVIGIVLFVGAQVWVSALPPVRAGSVTAVLGEVVPCSGDPADGQTSDCYIVPFAEGREVGIGFTVQNDAPIGMTILAADVILEGVLSPASLEPQLTRKDTIFGIGEGVPFAPIEVPAGTEQAIQFVGTYGHCETVAEQWPPDSGLSVSRAFLKVQWAWVFTTTVEIPVTPSLALASPTSCPCGDCAT